MFDPNLFPDPNSCYPPPAFAGDEFPAREGQEENPAELTRTRPLLEAALAAKPALAALSTEEKKAVLLTMADCLEEETPAILAANAKDLAAAQDTISPVMQDRLRLTEGRVADMAAGVRAVAALPDPVGSPPTLPASPSRRGACASCGGARSPSAPTPPSLPLCTRLWTGTACPGPW